MAVTKYVFTATNEQLQSLLQFALTFIVIPDISRIAVPGATLQMDLLLREGSCGDEDGSLQIDTYPFGQGLGVELIVVTYRESLANISQAGLYTFEEFNQGIRDELTRQLGLHPEWKENVLQFSKRFNIGSLDMS